MFFHWTSNVCRIRNGFIGSRSGVFCLSPFPSPPFPSLIKTLPLTFESYELEIYLPNLTRSISERPTTRDKLHCLGFYAEVIFLYIISLNQRMSWLQMPARRSGGHDIRVVSTLRWRFFGSSFVVQLAVGVFFCHVYCPRDQCIFFFCVARLFF